jgi:NTE family protein
MSERHHQALLERHLNALLGHIEPEALALLKARLEWVTLASGETLIAQGEPGDAMYMVISGRLRAYIRNDDGDERMVREMGRGQVIGELSLYTDEPRSATVVAIRDSVLVRLDQVAFKELLTTSAQLSILLTRQIIHRLQNPQPRSDLARPVTIALVPITEGTEPQRLAEDLARHLLKFGRVALVDAARVDHDLASPGLAQEAANDLVHQHRLGSYLDELEAGHEYLLLLADEQPTPWTQRCLRRCDEVLLLAHANQPPVLHPTEVTCLKREPRQRSETTETLVLLHPADRRIPQGTRAWLDRRPVNGHLHIRPGLERDLARLARFQAGQAVGLVFAGGGARGLAHVGVMQALAEQGIEPDVIGGTSIGAIMATLAASDQPLDHARAVAKRAFSVDPTGDLNPLPLLSLIQGRRLRRVVSQALDELVGRAIDIEDLWKTYYCVASNYSQAREQSFWRGDLLTAMFASIAIPGALPPVASEGDLLCDGGTFNNFPVDVMRRHRAVGPVIGVDLSSQQVRKPVAEVPSGWSLLLDRFRPRGRRRHRGMPSLMGYLMNVTVLYSTSRQREARKLTDLYLNPPLQRVGMLQWARFDEIAQYGYDHTHEALAQADAVLRQRLSGLPAPAVAG